jgi:hypothetical protein
LPSHDVLLAEGAPAESYLDCGNRGAFANAGQVATLYPEGAPTFDGRRFATPAQVAGLKARLAERATALGRGAALGAWRIHQQRRAAAPRENLVRNPRGEQAVRGRIGEGGAAPALWRLKAPARVAIEIVGSGLEGRLPYLDIRFAGCASARGACAIYPAPGAHISVEPGEDWTFSCHLRHVAGDFEGVAAVNLYFDEYGPKGDYVEGEAQRIRFPTDDALELQRISATYRMKRQETRAATAYLQAILEAGSSADFTLRVAGFQFERGDYASGLILPAPGAFGPVLRAAAAPEAAQAA